MPRIVEEVHYDGAAQRIERLGLTPLIDEIKEIISGFELVLEERVDANRGGRVRKLLDARFASSGGWTKKVVGDIDWLRCKRINGTRVCVGVEVQVSARSDFLVVDMIHLTAAFRDGRIDVGVLIVPSDKLSRFLTDRGPCISDAKKHARAARFEYSPLVLLAIEHEGTGPALKKQRKRRSKKRPSQL
jgi:hypothetical protein